LNDNLLKKLSIRSAREGIAHQRELARLVSRRWDGRRVEKVAGADVHFPSKDRVRAVIVICSFPALEPIETSVHEGPCTFPYIPGLLSFREIPSLVEAWKGLGEEPDLLLCDGQGIAHPRGVGLASHLGLLLEIPSIGCAKSPLYGRFELPGEKKGSRAPILGARERTIGTVLRTRDGIRPIYVSIGHMIGLRRAERTVLDCTPRFRIPEPLRAAHRLAGS
jgi:deoxyribonuclease V